MSAGGWRHRGTRWMGAVLLASLAVNAFFFGAAATDVLGMGRHPVPHGPGGTLFKIDLRWLDKRLPDDAMLKIETAMGERVPGAELRFERLHDLRTSFAKLIAAPVPDRAAIEAKLGEIRSELNGLLSETQAATVTSVLALPPATRASLVDDAGQG